MRSPWRLALVVGAFTLLAASSWAGEGPAAHTPPPGSRPLAAARPAAEVRSNVPEKRADRIVKNYGLDLQGTISATWGESGVRIQVDRVSNTSGSTSPELFLQLWATSMRPVFGETITPHVISGRASLGTLPNGGHLDNVDTGSLSYIAPPDGCYYVTVALETANSGGGYSYWSLAVLAYNGDELFSFGSSGCGVTPAQDGSLYATENSSNATLYRIDGFATNPQATALGVTGLGIPSIAIDPTSGILYAVDVSDGVLYQVDAQTARTRRVGSTGLASASPVALAFDGSGQLFSWGHNDGVLYRIDKSTANATYVGYTGYSAGGDLAFDLDGTLWGSTGTALVRIDSRTGAGTYVGAFGTDGIFGLAVAADGALYAGENTSSFFDSSRLHRVNKANAALTLMGDLDWSLGDLAVRGGGGSPPAVAFTWSPSNPTTGQAVQLTDQSSGNPTSWQWDLDGDGTADSTQRNPTRTYAAAGSYNVTLTACNAAGCAAVSHVLTVTAKPSLKLAGPASGTAYQALAFTATASGCTPNPFTWSWKSDVDQMSFDGFLGPLLGVNPLPSQTASANLGWTRPGSHTLHVTNSWCPGTEGVLTIDVQVPKDPSVEIYSPQIDKTLPTVVFCHGLQPESFDHSGHTLWSCVGDCLGTEVDHPAGNLPASGENKFNKVQVVWSGAGQGKTDAFAVDYVRAWEYTDDAGRQLAAKLVKTLGSNYEKSIQFVGHSLGSAVCGRAAVEFLKSEPKVNKLQLTVLDRPDHVHKLLHDHPYPNFETRFGFPEDYFPSLLATAMRSGLDLRLDNYWSTTGTGVGDSTSCLAGVKVYNHRKPAGLRDPGDVGNRYFRHESIGGFDIDHSGVHQWYRWTGDANGIATGKGDSAVCSGTTFTSPRNLLGFDVFDASLSPCEAGWNASLIGYPSAPFPTDASCDPATVRPEPVPVCIGVGRPCVAATGRTLAESEIAAAATGEREGQVGVAIPNYGRYLLFTLEVASPAAGSSAAVLLDDVPLWSGSLASFPANKPVGIGPLPLYGLTGNHTLALKVLGPASTTVRLSNLQVQKILVPCDAADALCVAAHRFRIEADWTDHQGNSGHATPRTLSSDASGFLWFFDQSNLELIVKVLNACGFPGSPRFWVYAAGLTDVEVRLTVTDTVTGAVKIYNNPQGTPFQPIQDTDAFATCRPGDALAAPAAPRPEAREIAGKSGLDQGRFTVSATWRTPQGQSGAGQFVPVTDNSGYFWFFDPGNVETVVKVLDGCGLNSRFWVFAAGLTNVQVDLVVTDTRTGAQVAYHNALGQSFLPIQDTSAFATCP